MSAKHARRSQRGRFDLVVLDFRLPDGDGLEILRELKQGGRREPVVFVTTSSSTAIAVDAMKIGAEDYIVKEEGYARGFALRRQRGDRSRPSHGARGDAAPAARAERLASLNTLMAGIAHNLNNPLTTVRTFAELLPSRYETDAEFRTSYYQLVLDEMERIRLLIGSMMQAVTVPNERAIHRGWRASCCASWRPTRAGLPREAPAPRDELPGRPAAVVAARESLKQALIILLDNAIAFSPEGGTVRCRAGCSSRRMECSRSRWPTRARESP